MDNKQFPTTLLDEKTQTPEMMAVKAIIPFLEPSVGKMAAVMVKLMEMKAAIEYLENGINISEAHTGDRKLMLEAVRPFCGEKAFEAMEFIEKMTEMRNMAEFLNAVNAADTEREEQNGRF